MSWTAGTGAILATDSVTGDGPVAVRAWSTATLRVEGSPTYYYMFGVDAASGTHLYGTMVPRSWTGAFLSATDNRRARWLYYGGGSASYHSGSLLPGIPSPADHATLEPVTIVYKDPCVVDLGGGRGRLMVVVRARINGQDQVVAPQPTGSVADLVAWWAPDADPGFRSTGVTGPFWLAACTDIVPRQRDVRLWIGTSGGVVLPATPSDLLYLYCTVEVAGYGVAVAPDVPGFKNGTHVRYVAVDDFLGVLAAETAAPGTYTDESAWDDLVRAELVPGVNVDRVYVWTRGNWELGGSDLESSKGTMVHVVDPAPTLCEGDSLPVLYFALIGGTPQEIWRAACIEPAKAPGYWPCWFIADDGADELAAGNVTDPDPVELGDSTWAVFIAVDSVATRFDGDHDDGCRRASVTRSTTSREVTVTSTTREDKVEWPWDLPF